MRGFSFLAAVAAVSTASGAIVPLDLVRASSSQALSSTIVHARPSYNYDDYPFDWALASSLAGLTGAPPTATVHQYTSTTTSSGAANTLSIAAESPPKAVEASTATTPSQNVASSSSKMVHPVWTAVNTDSAAPNTLATSIKSSTPLPKTHSQSTRASVPTSSYVPFLVS